VREAVRDQNLSDGEILAVLQCCDYNVEQTVTALHKGLLALYCSAYVLNTLPLQLLALIIVFIEAFYFCHTLVLVLFFTAYLSYLVVL